jgi:hypothetical protein
MAVTVTMPSKFTVKLWNNKYYCSVVMPDGTKQELNSDKDLTYSQWQEKIKAVWEASQKPPEPEKCPLGYEDCPYFKKD